MSKKKKKLISIEGSVEHKIHMGCRKDKRNSFGIKDGNIDIAIYKCFCRKCKRRRVHNLLIVVFGVAALFLLL